MYGAERLREAVLSPERITDSFLSPDSLPYDPCRNKWGAIKLKLVQHTYNLNVNASTIPELTRLYVDWRDAIELLPMRLTHKKVGYMNFKDTAVSADKWIYERECTSPGLLSVRFNDNPKCEAVSFEYLDQTWINKKSVKRGNDVYVDMLRKKFAPLINSQNHEEFFSTALNSKRRRVRRTRMLYLTGTCDQAITGDIAASWTAFGKYWNRFITGIRNKFGKAVYIRTWQSHSEPKSQGYPHFHALIYFEEIEFTTVYRPSDKSWRIHNRQEVVINKRTKKKKPCIDVLVDGWKWGGLEVLCCDSSRGALTDLLKYVLRDLEGGASDLTNTMVWYFQKKSFAVSRGFEELFGAFSEPENADLINAEGVIQEGTQEGTLVAVDVFPILPRDLMPFYRQLRLDELGTPPDPPPELVGFLDLFADLCAPAKSYTREDGVVVTVYKYADGLG